MFEWAAYETSDGWGGVAVSSFGVYGHILPVGNYALLSKAAKERWSATKPIKRLAILEVLESYFSGERVDFSDVPLDLSGFREFDRLVYEAAVKIPYGSLVTYGELGIEAGFPKAARAVGNAMAKNRLPLFIPCHRVVRSDGSLGGWSGVSGWKERLLCIEGALDTYGKVPLFRANTDSAR